MRFTLRFGRLAGFAFLIGSAARPQHLSAQVAASGADSAASEVSRRVVREFVDAYNRHDISGMLALADTALVWLSVEADSVRTETRGHAALRSSLTAYFQRLPTSHSTLESMVVLGPWVSARERASWTGASGPRSQSSISVYEVRDGRVRRVWYYPVVR